MAAIRFIERLNEQVANEFAAHQQYIANAVYFDGHTLPRLAAFFYAQAVEERNHAMMMVRYLLDSGAPVVVPGVEGPETEFADIVAPVALALEQERRVSEQIAALAAVARDENDYLSEQFVQWFLKEQIEEVSTMSSLLSVVERSSEAPMFIEDYLAREGAPERASDPTAPPAAGGTL
jgi:bacterioferritin B